MKAKISRVGVTLTVDLTDHQGMDCFLSLSNRKFRPMSLTINYDQGYTKGFGWELHSRIIKADGTLGVQEMRGGEYGMADKQMVARLDKLAESLNPMAAMSAAVGLNVPGTV